MERSTWDDTAIEVAGNIRENRYPFQRGLICVPYPSEDMVVAWLLGNDGYSLRQDVRRELAFIRQKLTGGEVQELAFGLSGDGYSWALALKADNQRYQTKAGKALHLQLLKIQLNDTILEAASHANREQVEER